MTIDNNTQETEINNTASFIERMCAEMTTIAHDSDLLMLAYLLEIAREEAASNLIISKPNKEK